MSVPRVIVCYDSNRPGMYLRVEGQDVTTFMEELEALVKEKA